MAQGESPRNPLAFASVLCPGRCLAVELVNSCAYWELPNGNAQRTQDLSRTFTPAEFSHSAASSFSSAASSPRKVPGLSANPRPRLRSRLRSRLRPRLRSRLRSRRRTCGRTKGGALL